MSLDILFKNILGIFRRFKWAGILNIMGMSVAFVAFTLIVMQVNFELTYNHFFSKADRIYTLELNESGKLQATLPIPLYEEILASIPEIVNGTLISSTAYPTDFMVLDNKGNKLFYEAAKSYANTTIIDVFDLTILSGDAKEALSDFNKILIPQSIAKKWFGHEDPLYKQVFVKSSRSETGLRPLEVGGIYKDLPANSSIKNHIYSRSFHTGDGLGNWNYIQFYEIPEGANLEEIARKIEGLDSYSQITDVGDKAAFRLLKEIYFTKNRIKDSKEVGNWTVTLLLLVLGIVILAIALINFINFSIALAPIRIKELNTHKTFGASATILRLYIFSEALVLSLLSAIIGLLICTALAKTDMQSLFVFSLNPFENFPIISFIVIASIIAGLLSGIYPAFYMTSFTPAVATKGSLALSPTGVKFRNTLVVFQYVVSMILLIGVFFIIKQMKYMQKKPWGIDKDYVVFLETNGELSVNRAAFFNELRTSPHVLDITYASDVLGRKATMDNWIFESPIVGKEKSFESRMLFVAPNFPEFFNYQLKEGEMFSGNQEGRVLVNETFIKEHHVDFPIIGEFNNFYIQGIVKDFHYFSLHSSIEPLMTVVSENWADQYYFIKINPLSGQEAINLIKTTLKKYSENLNDEIYFLEDDIQLAYQQEKNLSKLMSLFSIIAIIISLMGIYGLLLFTIKFKSREIGIRKVNGASNIEILSLLNKGFIKLMLIAIIMAIPIGIFLISRWLRVFEYKTNISAEIFIISPLLMLLITLLTISWQSWQAAKTNPSEVLKSE